MHLLRNIMNIRLIVFWDIRYQEYILLKLDDNTYSYKTSSEEIINISYNEVGTSINLSTIFKNTLMEERRYKI